MFAVQHSSMKRVVGVTLPSNLCPPRHVCRPFLGVLFFIIICIASSFHHIPHISFIVNLRPRTPAPFRIDFYLCTLCNGLSAFLKHRHWSIRVQGMERFFLKARLGQGCCHHLVENGLRYVRNKNNNKAWHVNQWCVKSNVDKATRMVSICHRPSFFRTRFTRTLGSMNRPTVLQRCWWSIAKNSFREQRERIN